MQKYGVISLASYEKIGGLTRVLGDYAEKIYGQLSQEEKEQARYIFTQLVQPISQEKSGEVSHIATRKIATFAEQNQQALIEISQITGKSQQELITSAIEDLINNYQQKKTLDLMQQAKGIWQDREDIPNVV